MRSEEELLEDVENYFKNVSKEQFLKDLEKAGCLHLIEGEKDFKAMAKAFIGETMKDFFCNGFFGSTNYCMTGAEITKVYDSDDDDAIIIEVKKLDGKYDYGYFEGGWRDWESVYEHLKEWTGIEVVVNKMTLLIENDLKVEIK